MRVIELGLIFHLICYILHKVSFRISSKGGGQNWTSIKFCGAQCNVQYHLIVGSGSPPPEMFWILGPLRLFLMRFKLRGILRYTGLCFFSVTAFMLWKCQGGARSFQEGSKCPPPLQKETLTNTTDIPTSHTHSHTHTHTHTAPQHSLVQT